MLCVEYPLDGREAAALHGLRVGRGRQYNGHVRLPGYGFTGSGLSTRRFPHQLLCGLVLLANRKYFWLLEDESVILPCVPGTGDRASPTPLSFAPEPVASPAEGGGALLGNSVSSSTKRALTSLAGYREGETTIEGPRDVAIGPQNGAGPGVGTTGTKAAEGGHYRPPSRGFPRVFGREQHQRRLDSVAA